MIRRPPRSTRTDPLFPYTTRFRSSGLNDAGLAASLHQMSTTELESGFLTGHGDIAPFTPQRLLREAASIDDAVDLAKAAPHFAAWTFFVSAAKSGKAARIEVTGEGVTAVSYAGAAVARSNHFLNPDIADRFFDEDTPKFTGNYDKRLD